METAPLNYFKLRARLKRVYRMMDSAGVIRIHPAELADLVYETIDPDQSAPEFVRWAAILELRQIARVVCAAKEASEGDVRLQLRYPGSDGAYVLREHLTYDERVANVERLRREAETKEAHSFSLMKETIETFIPAAIAAMRASEKKEQ